ncbi:MAG: DUF4825 domain-containing protein [Clostridia bacterium]|nr:DUF4825 domain-containing protein [Clostridia bacterium]
MFENLFTTKMSPDKKTIENRFFKIRTKNSNASKILSILFFSVLIVAITAGAILIAVNHKYGGSEGEISEIHTLYNLKNTFIGDAPKVREIVDLTNNSGYKVDGIQLRTDSEPYRLTVNFKVGNRSDYRHIDNTELRKMSALIFSLIPNVDELCYMFYDDFSDISNPETSFSGVYNSRYDLYMNATEKIDADYIASSCKNVDAFEEYYKYIASFKGEKAESEFMDKVYEFTGNDYEIIVNSAFGGDLKLDSLTENEYTFPDEFFGVKLEKYRKEQNVVSIMIYHMRNFKTDETRYCSFLYNNTENGVKMIASRWVSESEINVIQSLIIRSKMI